MLDLRGETTPDVPPDLTGGCYALRDQVPGVAECEQRVTHAALNKDRGLIDPATGDARRAGDLEAFFKACALVICFILLWLGVGNVLSVWLPTRDEPIRQRRQSGSLKQFLIAFVVAYLIGYLVNLMLIWWVLAAQALTQRLGTAVIPAVLIVLSCITMWVLLTVFAVALAQQPKVRRTLQKEIADYTANAEAQAFAAEQAAATAAAPVRDNPADPDLTRTAR